MVKPIHLVMLFHAVLMLAWLAYVLAVVRG